MGQFQVIFAFCMNNVNNKNKRIPLLLRQYDIASKVMILLCIEASIEANIFISFSVNIE